MEITWNTKLYCLLGNPVNKSLSPIIHNNIFQILNKNSIYLTFNVEENQLENTINGLKALKVQGFNVTIPYKKTIIKYLDDISPKAKAINAVNTVMNCNGKLIGYNTDGDGFIKTFYDNNIEIKNKNILLLGAGGAAYGIANSLAMENVKKIYIANRTEKNSIYLEENIKKTNNKVSTKTIDLNLTDINKEHIDIIINTTSIGMYPMENLSPLELNGFCKDTIIYDIVYKPYETKLMKDAKLKGFRAFGGLSMLINQGIFSQNIWQNLDEKNNFEIYKKIEGILKSYVE